MDNNLSCIIIDDEPLYAELLEMYIERIPFLSLTATCNNGLDALALLNKTPVDLVITDINMPNLTGVQFAQVIKNKSLVIFISSFPEYAVDGFELNVVDYLLKPVAFERFLQAAQKALQASQLLQKPDADAGFVFVKTAGKLVRVDIDDILYIEAKKEYINIVIKGNRQLLTLQSMRSMEQVLNKNRFIRVHKSYIVAVDKIDEIERSRIVIQNNYIPVGDSYREQFYNVIGQKNY